MSRAPRMGRPKGTWNPGTDTWILHAQQANVTENVLAAVQKGAYDHRNPVIRLMVADAVLHLHEGLREVRQDAAQEMRKLGRSWTEIGAVLGVSRQRAWQIGNGR